MDAPEKICQKCGRSYPATTQFFHRHSMGVGGLHPYCKVCRNAQQRLWNDAHVAELHVKSIRYSRGLRLATLRAYSGPVPRCACCGESYLEFLCIDRVGGDDKAHHAQLRAESRGSSTKLYRWLRDNQFPPGFRVLCHNCNMAIGFYGHCPHERERHE